jgi:hypothetical protein
MLDLLQDERSRKAIIENAYKRVIDFNLGKIAGQYYQEIYACK